MQNKRLNSYFERKTQEDCVLYQFYGTLERGKKGVRENMSKKGLSLRLPFVGK